jgi:hypothetical protein
MSPRHAAAACVETENREPQRHPGEEPIRSAASRATLQRQAGRVYRRALLTAAALVRRLRVDG